MKCVLLQAGALVELYGGVVGRLPPREVEKRKAVK